MKIKSTNICPKILFSGNNSCNMVLWEETLALSYRVWHHSDAILSGLAITLEVRTTELYKDSIMSYTNQLLYYREAPWLCVQINISH